MVHSLQKWWGAWFQISLVLNQKFGGKTFCAATILSRSYFLSQLMNHIYFFLNLLKTYQIFISNIWSKLNVIFLKLKLSISFCYNLNIFVAYVHQLRSCSRTGYTFPILGCFDTWWIFIDYAIDISKLLGHILDVLEARKFKVNHGLKYRSIPIRIGRIISKSADSNTESVC